MINLFLLFFLPLAFTNISPISPGNIAEIPIISESKATCPCSQDQNQHCRGGLYIDYYYNAPYSGFPANSSYLPPTDSVPVIVEKLRSIRDIVKEFVVEVGNEQSNVKKAIYVKNNFSKVKHILRAINKASNTTISDY